jgi:hypothetical protein
VYLHREWRGANVCWNPDAKDRDIDAGACDKI